MSTTPRCDVRWLGLVAPIATASYRVALGWGRLGIRRNVCDSAILCCPWVFLRHASCEFLTSKSKSFLSRYLENLPQRPGFDGRP